MKRLFAVLFCVTCLSPLMGSSAGHFDYDFNQERMIVDQGEIFLVSTFATCDGLTVYDFTGRRLWERKFNSKIVSWNVQRNVVLVFSKARTGTMTYLSCFDRTTGSLLWERP